MPLKGSCGWLLALVGGVWLAYADAAGATSTQPLEFELATLDGARFVKVSDFPDRMVLVNVWGSECPPCVKETPLLNAQSHKYPSVQFLGVGTDDRLMSLRFVDAYRVDYPQLQAPKDPSGLLRRLGDPHGALPFTVLLDKEHRICAQHAGAVDEEWLATAVHVCGADHPPD